MNNLMLVKGVRNGKGWKLAYKEVEETDNVLHSIFFDIDPCYDVKPYSLGEAYDVICEVLECEHNGIYTLYNEENNFMVVTLC